jgi:hypothetical protein
MPLSPMVSVLAGCFLSEGLFLPTHLAVPSREVAGEVPGHAKGLAPRHWTQDMETWTGHHFAFHHSMA